MDLNQLIAMAGGPAGVASMAQRLGLPQGAVEQVLGQLGQSAATGVRDPADLTREAAATTGVAPGAVEDVLGQLNNPSVGSGGFMDILDRNRDGSPVDEILGMARGFLGR